MTFPFSRDSGSATFTVLKLSSFFLHDQKEPKNLSYSEDLNPSLLFCLIRANVQCTFEPGSALG
ncbi:MAG: hypothetical protein ACK5D5_04275 [Bacteroidota bacterium]